LFQRNICDKIYWNYFIEYHGKNFCDAHFAIISKIIVNYETNQGDIKNTSHLIQILGEKFENYHQISSKNKKNSMVHLIEMPLIERNFVRIKFTFLDLTKFNSYCFENKQEPFIFGKVLFSDENKKKIDSKHEFERRQVKSKIARPPPSEKLHPSKTLLNKSKFQQKMRKSNN